MVEEVLEGSVWEAARIFMSINQDKMISGQLPQNHPESNDEDGRVMTRRVLSCNLHMSLAFGVW